MTLSDRIDAVIFDAGGVLTTSPGDMMVTSAAAHGLTLEQFIPIALGPLDTDGDHPWHALERGEIALEACRLAAEPVWRAEGFDSFPAPPDNLTEHLTAIAEMIDAATAVGAAGYRTAILSNSIREWTGWHDVVGGEQLVDVVVDSCVVGLRKPDPAIYQLTADRLGVAPDRCLFLDDFPWNLPPARALGMEVWHVTDAVAAAQELRATLGV